MKKMMIIGLTGSIGMGKSETAKMFQRAGVPVFDSDAAVHDLMKKEGAAVDLVDQAFPGVKTEKGIDRGLLGEKVFGDGEALRKLEEILHPMVSRKREDFFTQAHEEQQEMVVLDVPLLFETGGEALCDFTVVVSAPLEVQRKRVLSRPGMTEQKLDHILKKQMPDHEKRKRADFIVQTDQGFDFAEKQVQEIIETIRKK